MTKVFLKICLFVLAIDGFYLFVGQTVTQSEQHPPTELEITPETAPDALIAMGEGLVTNKGGCLICHKIAETGNERGPDLRGVGGRAATRRDGLGSEQYLTESLTQPGAFIVDGYSPIMPAANVPPADLNATEFKAVVAYLQSLGGEVTVEITQADVESARLSSAASGGISPQIAYLTDKGCVTCHDVTGESGQIAPPLTTAAHRLTEEELLQSIVDPDRVLAAGYSAGFMPPTYSEDLKPQELSQLVQYMVQLGGPAAGTTPWGRFLNLLNHPMLQLLALVFVFNAGAWWAIEWLEAR